MRTDDERVAKQAPPSRRDIFARPPRHAKFAAVEGRGSLVLRQAEGNAAINRRATAPHRSRCFTRAMLPAHKSVLRNSVSKGGTVNRPRTHVSHRKQTIAHVQGRNFPVHFLFQISRQNPMAPALCSLGGRSFSSVIMNRGEAPHLSRCSIRANSSLFSASYRSPVAPRCRVLPGVPKTLRVVGWLPGTVTRVETHLSRRKQTTGHASTRNVPEHRYFRILFAPQAHRKLGPLGARALLQACIIWRERIDQPRSGTCG